MKRSSRFSLIAVVFAALPGAAAWAADSCSIKLTQDPLVMRVGKDEFRIAFGLDAAPCKTDGCSGVIRYATTWETEDGARSTEQKSVSFTIPEGAERSLSVDRHYFDTAEAQHTTKVVSVAVDAISCGDSPETGLASR